MTLGARSLAAGRFKVSAKDFSEDRIKVLWCAVDNDNSDSIAQVEFSRFVKLARSDAAKGLGRQSTQGPRSLKKQMTFVGSSALSLEATSKATQDAHVAYEKKIKRKMVTPDELRAEVKKAGVGIPKGDELKKLAALFNERLDRIIPAGEAQTWFKVFKDFDTDQSGLLMFDEIESGVRDRLHIKPSELSEIRLKALWLAMDSDDNGYIESSEFHAFMGKPEIMKIETRQALLKQKSMKQRARRHNSNTILALQARDHIRRATDGSLAITASNESACPYYEADVVFIPLALRAHRCHVRLLCRRDAQ